MSLYIKFRPKEFDEMVGNSESLKSLEALMQKKDKPHTYLFTGPSGTGKTTAARICANKLGAKGHSIIEINSSNNRGIETIRDIIDQMQYKPFEGDIYVFIVDEVHQITSIAQNALLKPLEDTTNIVYFFLCTTDPQKLIKPLRNRCTTFNFLALDPKYIGKLLRKINREEKLNVDNKVINAISENSEGSPRKAIVLFEKIIGMEIEEALKIISMGVMEEDEKQVIDLCRVLLKGGWTEITKILKGLKGIDVEKIRYAVLGYMNSVLLNGANDRAAFVLEYFSEPFYNAGFSGVTLACYQAIYSK